MTDHLGYSKHSPIGKSRSRDLDSLFDIDWVNPAISVNMMAASFLSIEGMEKFTRFYGEVGRGFFDTPHPASPGHPSQEGNN